MAKGEELMALVRAGNRGAFEALVERYWPVAQRAALEVLGDAHLAQDVAQDVFADIYVQRERYRPLFSFHAYVTAMARHKSIDLLRRRRGRPLEAFDEALDPRTPESAYIDRMFRASLYAAVEALPESQRRMLKAYALEGRSYRDIAAGHGATVAQVKATLHRVRKALRRVREDWGPPP